MALSAKPSFLIIFLWKHSFVNLRYTNEFPSYVKTFLYKWLPQWLLASLLREFLLAFFPVGPLEYIFILKISESCEQYSFLTFSKHKKPIRGPQRRIQNILWEGELIPTLNVDHLTFAIADQTLLVVKLLASSYIPVSDGYAGVSCGGICVCTDNIPIDEPSGFGNLGNPLPQYLAIILNGTIVCGDVGITSILESVAGCVFSTSALDRWVRSSCISGSASSLNPKHFVLTARWYFNWHFAYGYKGLGTLCLDNALCTAEVTMVWQNFSYLLDFR